VVKGPSARFAKAKLSMEIAFGHLLNFATPASEWYTSSAMALAYRNPGRAPWDSNSPVNWESTFGEGGCLSRVAIGLLCVLDINLSYQSETNYPHEDQAQIMDGFNAGLWPYYLDNQAATTQVTFNSNGYLSASVHSSPSTPVIIGVVTKSADQFFGGG
jgi:hypothetical protein